MKSLLTITLCFFTILLTVGCKSCKEDIVCDDPTNELCPNYDPCLGKKKADFFPLWSNTLSGNKPDYYPSLFSYRVPYPNPDTLAILPSFLSLLCPDEHKKYRWQIGYHSSELTGQQVDLQFDTTHTGPIVIRLITEDKAIEGCLSDNGRDTVYKTIVLEKATPRPYDLFVYNDLYGSYKGADVGYPNSERTILIKNEFTFPGANLYNRIYGICPQCMPTGVLDSLHVMSTPLKNSFTSFEGNHDNIFTMYLRGYLIGQDSIYVKYLYATKIGVTGFTVKWIPENGWEWDIREFRGKRIN